MLAASLLFASCQNAQIGNSSTQTTVETNAAGEELVKIGAVENTESGLQLRRYTEITGDIYYAAVGLGSYGEEALAIPDTFRDLPVKLIAESAFSNSAKIKSVTIPDSVTTIGTRAFYNCTNLETVNFGANVSTIGTESFYACTSIKTLTLPRNLSVINDRAFWGCVCLEGIQIFDAITYIGRDAFYACKILQVDLEEDAHYIGNEENKQLMLTAVKDKTVTEFTVPEGTKYIGQTVFSEMKELKFVTIPAGVTVIAESAFQHCEKLTQIQFQGTKDAWNQISKGYLWDYETGKYTVTCIDGTISKNA